MHKTKRIDHEASGNRAGKGRVSTPGAQDMLCSFDVMLVLAAKSYET